MTVPLDSLTDRQRQCLRLVARDHSAKEIGQVLGISHETVNAHLKAAMTKIGANSRFAAARALADHEGGRGVGRTGEDTNPPLVSRPWVIDPVANGAIDATSYQSAAIDRDGATLHEERAIFGFADERPDDRPGHPRAAFDRRRPAGVRGNDLSVLQRILTIALLVVAIAIALIAVLPMSDAFQRLANTVMPIQH